MHKKTVKVLKYILSVVLAAVLVYFAFRSVEWTAFLEGLKQTRWGYVALFFAVSVGALIFREERWRTMMSPLDPDVKRLDAWDSANVGNMTNVVLPGAGEFVRCGYISSKKMSYDKAFGTIVCERAWDVASVLVLFIMALAIKWKDFGGFFIKNIYEPLFGKEAGKGYGLVLAIILIAIVAGIVFSIYKLRNRIGFCRKIADAIKGMATGFASFAHIKDKRLFIFSTLGIWIMYLLMTYLMFKAVPPLSHLGIIDAIFISSIGNIASVIPVPGGIGAYHYLTALSLSSLYGCSWETGILFATLSHELHAVLIVVLGVISYFRLSLRRKN